MDLLHLFLLLLICIPAVLSHTCSHDQFVVQHAHTKHYYNDLMDTRFLQETSIAKIRIFADYTQVNIGSRSEINTIKRVMNITAGYYYHILQVKRLNRLFFPQNSNNQLNAQGKIKCGKFIIPQKYITEGTIGDLGIVVGNQNSPSQSYIAQSTSCAFLQSNNRPIWGMIAWNNPLLRYDQQGFQQIVSIGIHQTTHILGFSAQLYETYPNGNPLRASSDEQQYYLWSPLIEKYILQYYNCSLNSSQKIKGLLLQDQDGTKISSHWEKKVVGNEIMIAGNSKNAYMSQFTLALLESTGWYENVNHSSYNEPKLWGKNGGCQFLDIDNCQNGQTGQQFCTSKQFQCDFDQTAIARCNVDTFTGSCKIPKHYTNTICVDQNYELKNLNSKLNAFERGGSNSRCFKSDFRQEGQLATALNFRCYISVCSFSGKYLFILVGSTIMVCRSPGQVIPSIVGFQGTLTCPTSFKNHCQSKKTCPYHCNKNGVCLNGLCQCTGSKQLTSSCVDVQTFDAPVGQSGGFLHSKKQRSISLQLQDIFPADPNSQEQNNSQNRNRGTFYTLSLDFKCFEGTVMDHTWGMCLKCSQVFNCQNCIQTGCISCDNGKKPIDGRCI